MLATFSLTDSDFTPDARQFQLDAMAINPDSKILQEGFINAHDNLVSITGITTDNEFDSDLIDQLRKVEILTLTSDTNSSIIASFDLSSEVTVKAKLSLITTIVVTLLLAVLGMLFSRDAFHVMIRPIEKMKSTVQKVWQ